jgi:short-subunit dehydrogenase
VKLEGKRIWVTGASRGIGRELVAELAARGAVIAASARDADALDELAAGQPNVHALPADVTDRESMLAVTSQIEHDIGAIDVAVLNAGYWRQIDVAAWDTAEVRRHVDTNLLGMVHGIEAVLPGMRRRRSGTIVGVASLAGYRGFPRAEAYGATKAAQISLLESLRIDLRPAGIHVQTICPGFVRTELTRANAFQMPFMLEPDDAARRIARGIEREAALVAFPLPMALAMGAARLVPAGLYAAAWNRALRRSAS